MLTFCQNETHPKMRGIKSKKIIWIGLVVLLTLILMGAGCQRRVINNDIVDNTVVDNTVDNTVGNDINNNTPPTNVIPPESGAPDPASVLASLKQETANATTQIKTLVIGGQPKTDLQLTIVSSKFINTLANTGLDTNWYIYTTPSDPANFYLINMPRNGSPAKRIIMPKTDFNFDFDVLPIPMDQWKKSYADALVAAEQRGGATFRSQHKTFEVSIILAYPAAGQQQQLSWSVAYKATDASGASFKVQVNAATGDAVVVP